MKLFLTSSPCDDNVPDGCTLPCIFFERNEFVTQLRACVDATKPCVVIAASPEHWGLNDEMTRTFAGCFAWHGMKFPDVEVIDSRNQADAANLLSGCGTIILGGGHVPTQNRFFREIGLKELLKSFDGVIMGISAGSMNCCGDVYAQPEEPGEAVDPDYQRFINGLGLTDVMILPHYNRVHDNYVDGLHLFRDISIPDSRGRTFTVLPDASYVLTDGKQATIYGEAWQITDSVMRKVTENGEKLSLSIG